MHVFFSSFSIEVDRKEANESVEHMKTKEKKPSKVCYFTFVTLFRSLCMSTKDGIYIQKKSVDTLLNIKQAK